MKLTQHIRETRGDRVSIPSRVSVRFEPDPDPPRLDLRRGVGTQWRFELSVGATLVSGTDTPTDELRRRAETIIRNELFGDIICELEEILFQFWELVPTDGSSEVQDKIERLLQNLRN